MALECSNYPRMGEIVRKKLDGWVWWKQYVFATRRNWIWQGSGGDLHPHTRGCPERSFLLRGKIIILDNPPPEV